MLSKSTVKYVQSLKLKKFRQKYNLFVAEGQKTVETMLRHDRLNLSKVYTDKAHSYLGQYISHQKDHVVVEDGELKKLSSQNSPGGVVALFELPENDFRMISDCSEVIYLDDIQDPGNMGTIIRIADWYGVKCVVRSEGSADFFSPKVVQATMGSLGHVATSTIRKSEFNGVFSDHLKIAAGLVENRPAQSISTGKKCLIIGNEGHGISNSIELLVDHYIYISPSDDHIAESLNAAVATGIVCQYLFGKPLQ